MVHDEHEYFLLRNEILTQPTRHEHKRASRIAEITETNKPAFPIDQLLAKKLKQKQDKYNSEYPMIVHYTHENRYRHYKRQLHKIWDRAFINTPIQQLKLIVGSINSRNLTQEIVRRAPNHRQKQQQHGKRRTKPNKKNQNETNTISLKF